MADALVRALMALARAKAAAQTVPDQQRRRRDDVLPILAVWFGSKAAVTATELPSELIAEMAAVGVDPVAAERAGRIVLEHPLSGRTAAGSPSRKPDATAAQKVAAEEPELRAEFLLNSAGRLSEAVEADDFDAAVAREERYAAQHVAAGQNRRKAAKKLDEVAAESPVLKWVAVLDKWTTPDCARLNGRLFVATNPPGLPGAMHTRCRCKAVPYAGSASLARILGGA